ncbi:hypothetical protein SprV_0401603600 [Sparganum proliferum]
MTVAIFMQTYSSESSTVIVDGDCVLYSRFEKEKYAELSNCTTELERLYHRRVKDLAKRESRKYFSLFTYINEDPELKSFQARLFK